MYDFSQNPNYQLYSPIATQAAATYGVPNSLLQYQIGAESSWNPNASNGAAQGIAQFIPSTALQYGVNVNDPTSSIYGAAAYDAALYQQTGDWGAVLQRYGTTGSAQNSPASMLAGLSSTPAPATGSTQPSTSAMLSGAASAIMNGLTGGVTIPTPDPMAAQSTIFGQPIARIVVVVLGLILVVAGLYMLKPVQEFVNNTASKVGEAGVGVAAVAAA